MATQALTVQKPVSLALKKQRAELKLKRQENTRENIVLLRDTVFQTGDFALKAISPFLPVIGYIGGILAVEYLYEHRSPSGDRWIQDKSLRDGMELIIDGAFIAHAFGLVKNYGSAASKPSGYR